MGARLGEEQPWLRVFGNTVQRQIIGRKGDEKTGEWRRLLRDLCCVICAA